MDPSYYDWEETSKAFEVNNHWLPSVKTTLSIRHLLTQTLLGCFMVRKVEPFPLPRCADCNKNHGLVWIIDHENFKLLYCEVCENYVSELI